jgi:radical SAM-linked protein
VSIDGEALQRLRIAYTKGEPLRYISHLDMMRLWERTFRRAELPVAHTQGFNPRPRIGMACPLPTGVTSRAELLDVFLTEWMDVAEVMRRLSDHLPGGMEVLRMDDVGLRMPALMSLAAVVEYQCHVLWDKPTDSLEAKLLEWMAQTSVMRERQRKGRRDTHDLRPLVERLWVIGPSGESWVIGMRLRSDPEGTGRPDEVLKALGLWDGATGVERTALLLSAA